MSSTADDVTQHGGEFPLLHLSGHLTPDAVWTEAGVQTVAAQSTLNTQERSTAVKVPVKKSPAFKILLQ